MSRGRPGARPGIPGNGGGGTGRGGRAAAAALALALAAAALAMHVGHLDRVGITWDEPPYFESVRRIQAWTARVATSPERVDALAPERIRQVWAWDAYHNPHPPLYKEVMAATEAATRGWLGPIAGFRLASLLWFALLAAGVGWVGARMWGTAAGVGAGLAVLLMPRLAGHAHIGATDMPLACLFFLAVVGLGRFLREGRTAWGVAGAVAFGLAMGTKFTGYLVPLPLLAWGIAYRVPVRRAAAALGLAALAVGVSTVVNPLAWHEPLAYVGGLVSESVGRADVIPINTMYLGRTYPFVLPWHHAVVMTIVTVPVAILLLAGWGGAAAALRGWRDEWLVGLSLVTIGFFWALLALPSSPNHDGVRLFLPLFPFLAILAGRGFGALVGRLPTSVPRGVRPATAAALGFLLFAPALRQTVEVRPLYLSYYNEAIGGLRGAAGRGMEVTYWFDALTPTFLEEVNRIVPGGSRLAAYPTQDHFRFLQDYGLLRSDIAIVDSLPAPYFLQYARTADFDALQWGLYRRVEPVEAQVVDDVTLAALYSWADEDSGAGRADEDSGTPPGPGGAP